jgi:hypothetical protein
MRLHYDESEVWWAGLCTNHHTSDSLLSRATPTASCQIGPDRRRPPLRHTERSEAGRDDRV